jgi:hypothetical protein
MNKDTNRSVREELCKELPIDLPKYIGLLMNFEQKIIEFGV